MSTPFDRDNPFAPPQAAVLEAPAPESAFVPEGRKVPNGRGVAWVSEAWALFLMAPGMWIALFVVFFVVWVVLAIIPLGSIVANLFFPVVVAGIMAGCRDVEAGGKLTFEHLLVGFRTRLGPLVLVGVLGLVAMMAVGFIVGVLAALAIPAFVGNVPTGSGFRAFAVMAPVVILVALAAMALMLPVIMAIWFAPALVAFHDMQPLAAFRASFGGCLKNFVPFLAYGLITLVLLIVAIIPFGLGLLVFVPLIWISAYTAYRDIFLER